VGGLEVVVDLGSFAEEEDAELDQLGSQVAWAAEHRLGHHPAEVKDDTADLARLGRQPMV
jgi:hypothetical protein